MEFITLINVNNCWFFNNYQHYHYYYNFVAAITMFHYTTDAFFFGLHRVTQSSKVMFTSSVNIRVCQPEISEHHFQGMIILMLTVKECTNCFVSFNFLLFILLKSDFPRLGVVD